MALNTFSKISRPAFSLFFEGGVVHKQTTQALLEAGISAGPSGDTDPIPASLFKKLTTYSFY